MKRLVISLVLLGIAGGCSSTFTLKQISRREPLEGRTLLLFNYELVTAALDLPQDGCQMNIRRSGQGYNYYVKMLHPRGSVLVEIEPGTYNVAELECGHLGNWNLEDTFLAKRGPFEVQAGKVNYLGAAHLIFTDDGRMSFDRPMTFHYVMLKQLFREGLSQSVAANVYSLFSGKWMTRSMVMNSRFAKKVTATGYRGANVEEVQTRLSEEIGLCGSNVKEGELFPVGTQDYYVTYRKGKLAKLDKPRGNHTFSDAYLACVESALKSFNPGDKGRIVMTVEL